MTATAAPTLKKTSGSAISRLIRANLPAAARRIRLMEATDQTVTVFTPNGARRQAAALSAARRLLLSKGYVVETIRGGASLPLAPHVYCLRVLGRE